MVIKSPYPTIDIPELDIPTFLFETKRPEKYNYPRDRPLFIDAKTGKSLSLKQIHDQSRRFGQGLKEKWGWKKGDVMCVFSTNQLTTCIVMWGTQYALGAVSPANPAYTEEELLHQLQDSRAKAIITIPELLPIAEAAARRANIPSDRIILFKADKSSRHPHFTELYSKNLAESTRGKIHPQDIAFLAYSSGTTGLAKGVMLTHKNIVSNTLMGAFLEAKAMHWSTDSMVSFLPFYHIYIFPISWDGLLTSSGLTAVLHCNAWDGLQAYILERFTLEDWLGTIQKYKITFAFVVPPIVLALAKDPIVDKYNLKSMKMLNSGAAPLTKELVEEMYARTGIPVKQGYGLTETSPTTNAQEWEHWRSHIGSIGKLCPNMEARFVDEDGNDVPHGKDGELWMKGPNVFKGYLNNEAATKNSFTTDGWFKTGDVGHVTNEGMFFITDRVKELIKFKGFQVPPAALEGLLASHPKVKDVAVLGLYSKSIASEVPRAYIVPVGEPSPALAKELVKFVHDQVAQHKRLRGGVVFVQEIPKTGSGKILRRLLKEEALKDPRDPMEQKQVTARL